jgi:WD40 repeat protein
MPSNSLGIANIKNGELIVRDFSYPGSCTGYFCSQNTMILIDTFLVVASPWDDSIKMFDVAQDSARLAFEGASHPSTIRSVSADSGHYLRDLHISIGSLSQDSTCFIWNMKINSDMHCTDIKKITVTKHVQPLIDFDISVDLDVTVTVDEEPSLVLSELSTGMFIRSQKLDATPYMVKITKCGYILVFRSSRICVHDLSLKFLWGKTLGSRIMSFDVVHVNHSDDVGVFALEDKTVVVLRIFELRDVMFGKVSRMPVHVAVGKGNVCFIVYEDGSVGMLSLFSELTKL